MTRKRGSMTFVQFKQIVDEIEGKINRIYLTNFGEPFLNDDLVNMIRYASNKGIRIKVSTNTTKLRNDLIKEILNCGLDQLIVCLDGATKTTHEKYRIGSNFEEVAENIKKICSEKKKRKLGKPTIVLQFIVMRHNEHEIDKIKELALKLGVDVLALKSVSLGSWGDNSLRKKFSEEYLPKNLDYIRYVSKNGVLKPKRHSEVCHWVMKNGVILWNGDLTICCYDYDGYYVIGNVFRDGGFFKLHKSDKFRKIRKKIVKKELELCKNCQMADFSIDVIPVDNVRDAK
jgi:radical SAM protein with 4Fe4S-binding SPASM domain